MSSGSYHNASMCIEVRGRAQQRLPREGCIVAENKKSRVPQDDFSKNRQPCRAWHKANAGPTR